MATSNYAPEFTLLVAQAEPAAGLALLEALIRDAVRARVSDIHVNPMARAFTVRFRIDGKLVDVSTIETGTGEQLVRAFEVGARIDSSTSRLSLDGRMTVQILGEDYELRVAAAPGLLGRKITARVLSNQLLQFDLANLGLGKNEEMVRDTLDSGNGLILVSGPTGSGKTTTAYALLSALLQKGVNLVTLEDPVEYQLDGATQIEVDTDTGFTFQEGIRSLLRHDPDALFLGEIRDAETAANAIDASFSGHTVISTIHARYCVSTVTMLRSMGVADHMLASALRLIINQRLVRRLCDECKDTRRLTTREVDWFESVDLKAPDQLSTPVGCEACGLTGHIDRQPLFSVWRIDDDAYDQILAGGDDRSLASSQESAVQSSVKQAGLRLLSRGEIDLACLRTLV